MDKVLFLGVQIFQTKITLEIMSPESVLRALQGRHKKYTRNGQNQVQDYLKRMLKKSFLLFRLLS